MQSMFAIVVGLLALGAAAADAGGDGSAANDAPAATETQPRGAQPPEPEAMRLYDEGLRRFRAGDYRGAVEALKAAHAIEPLPALLYDIAQALRLEGDCAEALVFYRRFLDAGPVGRPRALAEVRAADMQRCADAAAGAAPRPLPPARPGDVAAAAVRPGDVAVAAAGPGDVAVPAAAAPPSLSVAQPPAPLLLVAPAPPPHASDRTRALGRRRAGVITAVAAAALASASGYFSWRASVASDEVSGAFVPGGTWTDMARAADRSGALNERLAIATGVGAVAVGGLAAWLLSR